MPVPITGTKVSDVVTEIAGVQDSLDDCVTDAVLSGFDATYYTAPPDRLRDFRNYSDADTDPPTAPVLSLGIVGSTTQGLSWTASTDNIGISGYFYQFRLDSGAYGASVDVGNVLSTTVTGLDNGQTYWFRVQARDTSGNYSAWSNSLSSQLLDTIAPDDAFIAEDGFDDTTITVIWDECFDNVQTIGYRLSRDGSFITNVGSATFSYTFTGLTAGTTYTLGVSAYDAAGNYGGEDTIDVTTVSSVSLGLSAVLLAIPAQNSAAWAYRSVNVADYIGATVRLVVESVSTSDGFVGDNQLDDIFIGTANRDPEGGVYSFERAFGTNVYTAQTWAALTTGSSGINWLRLSGIPGSTGTGIAARTGSFTYYTETSGSSIGSYWLRSGTIVLASSTLSMWTAQAGAECGAINIYLDVISVPGPPDTEDPTDPTSLTTISKTDTTILLGWTASTDNVGVSYYRITRDGSLVTTVTGTSYTFTGLTAATAYTLGVQAFDAAGNSSNVVTKIETTDSGPALAIISLSPFSSTTALGACSLGITQQHYTDGVLGLPQVGDIIYTDAGGTNPVSGGNQYWQWGSPSEWALRIDSSGTVTQRTPC